MADVEWVNGYTRKDGTVVEGFWRRCRTQSAEPDAQARVSAGLAALRQQRVDHSPETGPDADPAPTADPPTVAIPEGMSTFCGVTDGDRIDSGVFIRVTRMSGRDTLVGPYPSEQVADQFINSSVTVEDLCTERLHDDMVDDCFIEHVDSVGRTEVLVPDATEELTGRIWMLDNRDDVSFEAGGHRINVRNEFTSQSSQFDHDTRKGRLTILATNPDGLTTRQEISYDNRRGIDNQGGETAALGHAARVVLKRIGEPYEAPR